jgi:FMN-dependent NADH-azoreductase
LSEIAQYAQELMLASLKAQGEFMRPAEQQQQAVSSTASAAGPLFQAWQSVFTAPMYSGSTFAPRHH